MVCGLRSAVCGLRSAVCGLRSAVCGLRSAVCGLRSTVCGLRSTVCGLRSAVCGLRFRDLRFGDTRCISSMKDISQFLPWDGAVALVIPEDDGVTIPEEPEDEDEDEGVTREDEAELTACLKSGCWIICRTRLSKQFVFAILGG